MAIVPAQSSALEAPAVERLETPDFGTLSTGERKGLLLAVVVVILLGAIGAFVVRYQDRLGAILAGECDLRGQWRYSPSHAVDAGSVARLDVDEIHRNLFPRWVIAVSRVLDAPERELDAFERLRESVAGDQNLTDILDELREIILSNDLIDRAERVQYLTWAWGTYFDIVDQPYWVRGGVGLRRNQRGYYYLTTYRTIADLDVDVAGQTRRVRVVGRVDRTTMRERHLGAVHQIDDGAFVVVDRLQEFAMDSVWPLLGPEPPSSQDPFEVAFHSHVAREAAAALTAEQLQVLGRTAASRSGLMAALESMEAREFCNGFVFNRSPMLGFEQSGRLAFSYLAMAFDGFLCPPVKPEEAEEVARFSDALGAEPELGEAVDALVAYLARTVAIHETRHLADEAEGGIELEECPQCGLPGVSSEVSAYLASIAWGPAPATTYYQACRAVQYGANPHAAAMEVIELALDTECFAGPPEGLAERAQQLERELFGRSEPITLPASFPDAIALPRDG